MIADELPPRPLLLARVHPRDGRLPHASTARTATRSCWPPTSTTCRSSARRSPIARPASAWWPISTPAATARRSSIDSVKDFYELTQLKIKNPTTGIFMIGGGVPKNFTQDIVVAADILGRRGADAQVRRADHRGRRPRRGPLQLARSRRPAVGARSIPPTSRWSSAKPRSPCR